MTCAVECARWFYARLMGLHGPDWRRLASSQAEATIGRALARRAYRTLARKPGSSSWGAYQHYGHIGDRLVAVARKKAIANAIAAAGATSTDTASVDITAVAVVVRVSDPRRFLQRQPRKARPWLTKARRRRSSLTIRNASSSTASTSEPEITPSRRDPSTRSQSRCGSVPETATFGTTHGADRARSFALPFGVSEKIEKAGWAIVFGAGTPASVRDALKPLIEHRRKQAGRLLKEFDYNGEQLRDWLGKQGVSPGNMKPAKLPYYVTAGRFARANSVRVPVSARRRICRGSPVVR